MNQVFITAIIFFSVVWGVDKVVNRVALKKERMALIKKDRDVKGLDFPQHKKALFSFNGLKYGIVAIGLSIGCLLGSFIDQYQLLANNVVGYFFSISLFVGIALVTSHYLRKKLSTSTKKSRPLKI